MSLPVCVPLLLRIHLLIEHLLCPRHCSRSLRHIRKKTDKDLGARVRRKGGGWSCKLVKTPHSHVTLQKHRAEVSK